MNGKRKRVLEKEDTRERRKNESKPRDGKTFFFFFFLQVPDRVTDMVCTAQASWHLHAKRKEGSELDRRRDNHRTRQNAGEKQQTGARTTQVSIVLFWFFVFPGRNL